LSISSLFSCPAGIPHPSLSPPGNPDEGKLEVDKKTPVIDFLYQMDRIVVQA
jgi:hypothetical protein